VTVDENLRGKTRTMRKRGASYETALEVFNEGLRRFPKSTLLLYGSSVAMQAAWFTDRRGLSPTRCLLEDAISL
ncbi:unnamed protein product, partial [Ascophyllum nodosum]